MSRKQTAVVVLGAALVGRAVLGDVIGRQAKVLGLGVFELAVLGALVSVNQGLDGAGRMAIVVPEGALRRVFEVTGLDLLFPVQASLEAALSDGAGLVDRCVA